MSPLPTVTARRTVALSVPAVALVLVLAACGGGSGSSSTGAAGTTAATAPSAARTPSTPRVSGTIAAVSSNLMQVQSSDSQTGVAWTGSTTISARVTGALSDVTVGSCIVAVTGGSSSGGSSSGSATAATVRISAAKDGVCSTELGGGRGGQGGMPTGGAMPTGGPDGMPSGGPGGADGMGMPSGGAMPSGMAGGRTGFGGVFAGLVTAVSGDTITVQETSQSSSATKTVTVSSATTYTKTQSATSAALVVGQCATASGPEDSSGQMTATTIEVFAPTDGSCTTGFGGNRGGRPTAGATSNG